MSARTLVSGKQRKLLDAIIALVVWMIWKERNNRVFNREIALLHQLQIIHDELNKWRLVGANCYEALLQ